MTCRTSWDIKAANILTTSAGIVKLADFGVSSSLADAGQKQVVGSPYWMAPEIIELNGAVPGSDIWSVGCTIIELLQGHPPYYDMTPMSAMFQIVNDPFPPVPENLSAPLSDFLTQCLHKDPNLRPSAKILLKHRWLKQNTENSRVASAVEESHVENNWEDDFQLDDEEILMQKAWKNNLPVKVVKTATPTPMKPAGPSPLKSSVSKATLYEDNDAEDDNWDNDFEGELSLPQKPKHKPAPNYRADDSIYIETSSLTLNDYSDDFLGDLDSRELVFKKSTGSSGDSHKEYQDPFNQIFDEVAEKDSLRQAQTVLVERQAKSIIRRMSDTSSTVFSEAATELLALLKSNPGAYPIILGQSKFWTEFLGYFRSKNISLTRVKMSLRIINEMNSQAEDLWTMMLMSGLVPSIIGLGDEHYPLEVRPDDEFKEQLADMPGLKYLMELRVTDLKLTLQRVKLFRNLSLHPKASEKMESKGLIEVLVQSLSKNQVSDDELSCTVQTVVNLCRLSQSRHERAILAGFPRYVGSFILSNHSLKSVVIPICCEWAQVGHKYRQILLNMGIIQVYLSLLNDIQWQVAAIDAIVAWLIEDRTFVEAQLLKKIDILLNSITNTTPGNAEGLIAAFQKILSISPILAEVFARETFIYRLRIYLRSSNALVRLNVLKIIDSMMGTAKAEVAFRDTSVQEKISRMSVSDKALLVRELAARLCTKFRKIL
ncbi:hypothetical protein HDV05_007098 [Chytridiales sp. JEL 0842]|nr:hypothetical protein HDV05_007098 [Chytridiales sp. JEL 0842]